MWLCALTEPETSETWTAQGQLDLAAAFHTNNEAELDVELKLCGLPAGYPSTQQLLGSCAFAIPLWLGAQHSAPAPAQLWVLLCGDSCL